MIQITDAPSRTRDTIPFRSASKCIVVGEREMCQDLECLCLVSINPNIWPLCQCGGRPLCNCDGMDTGNRLDQLSEQQGLHSLNLRQGGMRKSFWLQASKHTRWCTTISDSATINMPELECCCMSSIIWQPFTSPPRLPLLEMSWQIFVEKPCNIQ